MMPAARTAAFAVALMTGSLAFATDLATAGRSDYAIVVPAAAQPAEQRTAKEVQSHLKQITGAELPITSAAAAADLAAHAIVIGNAFLPAAGDKSLGDEGFLVKTVGDRVYLAGPTPRATMYAGDEFLERLGVRFLAPDVTHIPHQSTLALPALDVRQTPAFEYREPYFTEAFDRDWAARLRMNGNAQNLDESTGGKVTYGLFVHTFDTLIPRSLYKEHPEYFPLVNGQRKDGYVQRCLTNPEVLKVTIANLEKAIADNPKAKIFSVSQNDCGDWCTCDGCKGLTEKYGAHSGLYLHFVNQVAEAIEKDHPDVLIDTLAYQFTEAAPHGIKPRANVRVRLCPISNCVGHPFEQCTDPADVSFMKTLKNWGALTDTLYIWHYNTDFANYLMPFPDFAELAADVPMYRRHGVRGIFFEGAYAGGGGGSDAVLRSYVMAKLLWDDKADLNTLVNEWMGGVYGDAAAKPMRQWFDLLESKVRPPGVHLHVYDPPSAAYLAGDTIPRGEALLDEAEKLATGPAAKKYVGLARLDLRYVKLMQHPTNGPEFTEFMKGVRAAGIANVSEGQTFDQWEPAYLAQFAKKK